MNALYLDTSALVKLYIRETSSAAVKRSVKRASLVATSRVAYAEARAAFARRTREGLLTSRTLRRIVKALDRDRTTYVLVEITESVSTTAGELAERRALRGFDAIHLASALELGTALGALPDFMAFDRRLAVAAAAEGLTVL